MPRRSDRVVRLVERVGGEWCEVPPGPNAEAAGVTVAALRGLGRVQDVDAAQVAGFLSLAVAVDSDPLNAALWREYRGAECDLRQVGGDGDLDPLAELAAQFDAEMGDAEDA